MHKETSAVDGDTPICNGKLRCINVTTHFDIFVASTCVNCVKLLQGLGMGVFVFVHQIIFGFSPLVGCRNSPPYTLPWSECMYSIYFPFISPIETKEI